MSDTDRLVPLISSTLLREVPLFRSLLRLQENNTNYYTDFVSCLYFVIKNIRHLTDFLEGKKRRIYVVNEEPRILKYYKPTLLSFLSMRKKKTIFYTRLLLKYLGNSGSTRETLPIIRSTTKSPPKRSNSNRHKQRTPNRPLNEEPQSPMILGSCCIQFGCSRRLHPATDWNIEFWLRNRE